jgi:four helix bundle protein
MSTRGKPAREFEDLHVYQQARALSNRIYALTRNSAFGRDYNLQDQIRRASLSILSNIAEGFELGSDAAFAHSLTIAKGSGGEVRAQAAITLDQNYIKQSDYSSSVIDCRRLSAGLARLIAYLQRSSRKKRPLSHRS